MHNWPAERPGKMFLKVGDVCSMPTYVDIIVRDKNLRAPTGI